MTPYFLGPFFFSSATLLLCVSLASSPNASAHHSPNDVIEALTQRISGGERTAKVLVQRGDEYRSIGKEELATADYESALKRNVEYIPAFYGLAHVYYGQLRLDESQKISEHGLAVARNANESSPFHAILARIHERNEQWERALDSWRHSLASSRPNVNWFLGEARTLKKLNRINEARESLEAAMNRNSSIVLRRTWLDTLIRCGDTLEAEKHISAGLARARWKSSWLLLRARIRMAQNQPDAARQDAHAALSEIDLRWSPNSVNPFLTADRGLALLLLGRHEEARACTELAYSYGVSRE